MQLHFLQKGWVGGIVLVPVRTRQGKIGFLDIISRHKTIAFFTRMPSHPTAVRPVFDASRSHHIVPFMLNRINSQQLFPASRLQLYLGRALKLLKQLLWRVILVTLPGYGARCSGVRGGGQRAPRCRSPREREAGRRSHRPDPSSRLGPEVIRNGCSPQFRNLLGQDLVPIPK